MSLIGKGPTMLLAIMLAVALACTAALLAGDAPAFAEEPCDSDPSTPDCLAITSVSPSPGAKDVPLDHGSDVPFGPGSFATAHFNQPISPSALHKQIRLKNLDKGGLNVTGAIWYDVSRFVMAVQPDTLNSMGDPIFECGTTYKVRVGGGPRSGEVRSESGQNISEVPAGVTLRDGIARWKFSTVACS